ncbi:hypothetical protein [Actinoplanes sp. NPDC020271]|uniref:hypothetical protein n=1 Tax=Actinoplanes sp. NPDC020271 TaxID=3363896 RepID=UPI0037A90AAF
MPEHVHQEARSARPSRPPRTTGGHAPNDAASVLALQRTVGNAAVGRLLTIQRVQQNQAAALPAPITINEVEEIRRYRADTPNADVQDLLDQLIPHLDRISAWNRQNGTGGGHTQIDQDATAAAGSNRYAINYAGNGTVPQQVAILVHELTHVLINESYDSDMLNYPVAPLPAGSAATTESQRQSERIAATDPEQLRQFEAYVTSTAADLLHLLPGAGFAPARVSEVAQKLSGHTATKPMFEFDAVLSHLLTWSDQDDIATTSPFYQRLRAAVAETRTWRQTGVVTPGPAGSVDTELGRVTSAWPAINAVTRPPAPPRPRTRDRILAILNKLKR